MAPALICTVYIVWHTLFVFVVALVLAYLLYPLGDAIDRRLSRRRPDSALALSFVLILSLLAVFVVFVGRQVHREVDEFKSSSQSPAFIERVMEWKFMGIPIGEEIAENSRDLPVMAPQLELGPRLLTASRGLIDLFIVSIPGFLMLKGGAGVRDHLLEILDGNRAAVEAFPNDAHRPMLQYMRASASLSVNADLLQRRAYPTGRSLRISPGIARLLSGINTHGGTAWGFDEAERKIRDDAERHSGVNPHTIGKRSDSEGRQPLAE